MRIINKYDIFELEKDINSVIKKGMQGVVLEILDSEVYEVEFVKTDGTNFQFEGNVTFTVDSSFIGPIVKSL